MIIYILFVWIANMIIFLSLPRNHFLTCVLSPFPSLSEIKPAIQFKCSH